jgi:nicotinamidase-related amidase
MSPIFRALKVLAFASIAVFSVAECKQRAALLVIDVQNCFITGGLALSASPAQQDGAEVVPLLNALLQKHRENDLFSLVAYSIDWHPQNHISFFSNLESNLEMRPIEQDVSGVSVFDTVTFKGPPPFDQRLWPDHCVQNTTDANLHAELDEVPNSVRIFKGINPEVDSYSALFDNVPSQGKTGLDEILANNNIDTVYVAGLATDYCVGFTALDSLQKLNYSTAVILDASRGVADDSIAAMIEDIKAAGGITVQSSQVPDLITGRLEWPAPKGDASAMTVASYLCFMISVIVASLGAVFSRG